MKLRLVQKDINNHNYQKFLDNAMLSDIDWVCFGELSASGCLYQGGKGLTVDDIITNLKSYDFAVSLGFPQQEGAKLYNSYFYYYQGSYQIYHKMHLFEPMNETKVYQSGQKLGLFKTVFGLFGVAICYDLRFSDLFPLLKEAGAQKIIVPAAFPRVRIADWRELLVKRAKENQVYIIGINAVGDDGVNEFGGSSMVVDATGEIIVQADEIHETVVDIDI